MFYFLRRQKLEKLRKKKQLYPLDVVMIILKKRIN